MILMQVVGLVCGGLLSCAVLISHRATSNAIWDDYEKSITDEVNAPENLARVIAQPAIIAEVRLIGRWTEYPTLDVRLQDGSDKCVARMSDGIPQALDALSKVGVDIKKAAAEYENCRAVKKAKAQAKKA